jgi:hypothetical protein
MKKLGKEDGKKIYENLNDRQKNIMESLGRMEQVKLMLDLQKVIKGLCISCRKKAMMKPSAPPIDEFCETCQKKVNDTLSKYQK